MPGLTLLDRQIAKVRDPNGVIDYAALKALVADAYNEKELDRRRADRASQLVAEELEEALGELELQNLRFKAALDNMGQGLALFDKSGKLVVCNRTFVELFGLQGEAGCIGYQLYEILEKSNALNADTSMERRLLSVEHEFLDRKQGGSIEQMWPDGRQISIVRRPVADGGFLDTVADITANKEAAERIYHMARHDALTDLPNRTLLRERLAQAILETDGDHTAAVLCLDLDRFKQVNDTLGHPVGDALLVLVGQRLRALVRDGDTVARLGGDEFAIIQRLKPSHAEPEALARRIVTQLSRPYDVNGQQVQIGASVGIERLTDPAQNPDDVLRNADLALYKAKNEGRGCYRVFEPAMHIIASRKRQMELDLRAALDHHQFEVHYQPQVDIKSGTICAFEALVRWRHPTRGLVAPGEFITLSEEVGLIDRLGAYVLHTACRDAVTWPQPLKIAVNLSALQFRTQRLVQLVQAALDDSGLHPERLELEITEGVMIDDTDSVVGQLRELKAMGVKISLDDFGTGYSSLSYIRNFPFDKIKIDQSFVKGLGVTADSLAIIRAVAGMCTSLGIATTAEGVETDEQLAILTAEKCDSVQGFLFGKAVSAAETLKLFARLPFARAA